jgi:polysaccharide biosynthesis protein PslG
MQPPSAEEFARMAAGGIGVVRLDFYQGRIEPQPGVRDWTTYDRIVRDAALNGVRIAPLFFGTPQWMNEKPATMPIQSGAQEASWSSFVLDTARRYGPGGSFWNEHPEVRYLPATQWEVWNEPNITGFTGGQPASPWRYARLLALTDQALAAASPENRVILAGLYRQPRLGIPMTRFLENLYRVKGARRHFDAVAIHPYATLPREVMKVLDRARQIMTAHKDARKPMMITELGWTTGGQGWAKSDFRTTPAAQAARLRSTFQLLIKNRRALHLRQVIWHTWRDYSHPSDFWAYHMGLFTVDGQPKPAWGALLRFTGGSGFGPISVDETARPPGSE